MRASWSERIGSYSIGAWVQQSWRGIALFRVYGDGLALACGPVVLWFCHAQKALDEAATMEPEDRT